jgi:hypothetical protein
MRASCLPKKEGEPMRIRSFPRISEIFRRAGFGGTWVSAAYIANVVGTVDHCPLQWRCGGSDEER